MSTLALQRNTESRWSWLRISGLSGSFGIHVTALVILALPAAIPAMRPAPKVISAVIHNEPVELPIAEIPPEPQPQRLPKQQEQPRAISPPIVVERSVMATPVRVPTNHITESSVASPVVDINPAVAKNASLAYESIVEPTYPRESRRRGEHGTVLLRVLVGRNGIPIDIAIERSSGYRQLDRAAREAVLRWRFRPVQISGVTVEAYGLVPIKFDVNRG